MKIYLYPLCKATTLTICLLFFAISFFAQTTGSKDCSVATALQDNNNYKAAIIEWTKCLENEPNSVQILTNRGSCYMGIEDYAKASVDFQLAIKEDSLNGLALYSIGWIFYLQGKFENAISHSKASSSKLKDAFVFNLIIAASYESLLMYSEAIVTFSDYLKYDSLDSDVFSSRARCYKEKKQFALSLKDYTSAINLSPNKSDLYGERANCRINMKDNANAMVDFNSAIRLDAKNGVAFSDRGRLKLDLGDNKGAVLDFDKAILIQPKDVSSLGLRSIAKVRMNDLNGALIDANKCVVLDSENGYYYFWRGQIKFELKNYQGACNDYSKAGELGYMEAYEYIKEDCN